MKDEKWWAMAHEWYRDVVKVARTAVWYREGYGGYRTGPSILAQQDWFRIGGGSSNATEYGGWVKTGSRTTEDFQQEDWFRVGPPDGHRTGGDHDIKHLRTDDSGSMTIKTRKTGGDGEGGYVPWNRLAHSGDWGFRTGDFYRLAHTCPF